MRRRATDAPSRVGVPRTPPRAARLLIAAIAGAATAAAWLGGCERARPGALPAEPALEALVDSILPRIAQLAALELRQPVRVERRSRAEVRTFVEQRLAEEYPPEQLEGLRLTYVTLGLLADTLDLRALLLDLYAEQVIGYYDPRSERLYLVEGVAPAALRPVLVHELVHALQDQHADLDSLVSRERGNDRQTAAHAALEGHAMLVMFAYLAEIATGTPIEPELLPNPADELEQSIEADGIGVLQRAPAIIRRALLFPYVAGAGFVHQLWLYRRADEPRRAPLGELLPQSTQQVMNPVDRFILARDEPLELRFTDPPGWPVRYENTLGAFEIGVYLDEHLGAGPATADDWAGDRLRLLAAPDGEPVVIWYSAWRDEAAAERFANALRQVDRRDAGRSYDVERLDIDGVPAVRAIIIAAGAATTAAAVPIAEIDIFASRDGTVADSPARLQTPR